jgi:hypothetical protein
MQVIHDDEAAGLMMIPLMVDWHIPQMCQIEGCAERTTTIVSFTDDESGGNGPVTIGICERHYVEANETQRFEYTVKLC